MSSRCQRGFTLIEILIALTVLAVAMGAIIKAASDYTGSVVHLRDRTMANWVARNTLNELQIRQDWPSPGERKGSMKMGEVVWDWLAKFTSTDEPELLRVDVEVRHEDADTDTTPVTVLSGFLRKP